MYNIVIERSYYPRGTNGILSYRGREICKTIELPWLDNQPQISCIPEGTYKILSRENEQFGHHVWITGVPGRTGILMHPANNALLELRGCIAPVMKVTGEGEGIMSKKALEEILFAVYEDLLLMKPVSLIINSKPTNHAKEYNQPGAAWFEADPGNRA